MKNSLHSGLKRVHWIIGLLSLLLSSILVSCLPTSAQSSWMLTYTVEDTDSYKTYFYGIPIGCFKENRPCIDEPTLLFEIPYLVTRYHWSPKDQSLIYQGVTLDDPFGSLFLYKKNDSSVHQLTANEKIGSFAWSPDGELIIYQNIDWDTGESNFNVIDFMGRVQPLPDLDDYLENATVFDWYTQDVSQALLVLRSDFNGFWQIYSLPLDGSRYEQLTNFSFHSYTPAISPEADRIVFSKQDDNLGVDSLMLLDLSTNKLIELIDDDNRQYSPTWAPEGGWIAVISGMRPDYRILLVNALSLEVIELSEAGPYHQLGWLLLRIER